MAIDPICKMTVDEDTALSIEEDGQTHYFCSEHCRSKFLNQQPVTTSGQSEEPDRSCCDHPEREELGPDTDKAHRTKQRTESANSSAAYICPMCPGVESEKPGSCPKCGMALERANPTAPSSKTIYTCPMHPEVEQDEPGDCPICGMRLEPKTVTLDNEEDDSELNDMSRRFWIGLVLTVPLFAMTMAEMVGIPLSNWISPAVSGWLQLILATPVVLWAGWPFFVRGWRSIVNRSLNMFTLIAIGTGAAYLTA